MSSWVEDKTKLESFISRVDEMRGLRLIKSGSFKKLNFKMSLKSKRNVEDESSSLELTQIDEDDFRSFLMAFRQFWMQKETLQINKILNLCRKYLKPEHFDKHANMSKLWRNSQHSPMMLHDGTKEVTRQVTLDAWLNGYYFHNVTDLALDVKRWREDDWSLMYRAELLFAVHEMFEVIQLMGRFVTDALAQEWFDFDNPNF